MTIFTSMPLPSRTLTFWITLFLVKKWTTAQVSTCADICSIDDGLVLVNPSVELSFAGDQFLSCEDVVTNGTAQLTIFCPIFEEIATLLCCGPAPGLALVDAVVPRTVRVGEFSVLFAALDAADLVSVLAGSTGPYTLFAPTDDAFMELPEGLVDALLLPENEDFLSEILLYHILPGEFFSTDLADDMMLPPTLESSSVRVSISNETGIIMINEANIVGEDISVPNGIIHVIDAVLVPESISSILPDFLANFTNATNATEAF